MSEQDEYGFLNNIDAKVAVIMFILATAFTLGAVVLNVVAHDKECTVQKYVYCGDAPVFPKH